jgi:hypothetical protein
MIEGVRFVPNQAVGNSLDRPKPGSERRDRCGSGFRVVPEDRGGSEQALDFLVPFGLGKGRIIQG